MYALLLLGGGAFGFGAWQHSVLLMAGGPVAVALLVALVSLAAANKVAARQFYWGFAQTLGLQYASALELPPLTPLLGAGDRRHCEHWMGGRLPGELGLRGGLGHLVWEVRKRDHEGDELTLQRHRFTICTADIEPAMHLFHGVFLRPKRGVFPAHGDWLSQTHKRSIETESSDFTERFDLFISNDQDEVLARQLLSPTLVSWLASHPLAPGFELRAGALVFYVPRALEDAGNLTFLLDGARHVASRVIAEVEQARSRPAA